MFDKISSISLKIIKKFQEILTNDNYF